MLSVVHLHTMRFYHRSVFLHKLYSFSLLSLYAHPPPQLQWVLPRRPCFCPGPKLRIACVSDNMPKPRVPPIWAPGVNHQSPARYCPAREVPHTLRSDKCQRIHSSSATIALFSIATDIPARVGGKITPHLRGQDYRLRARRWHCSRLARCLG